MVNNTSELDALLQAPPKVHFMNNAWVLGGFGPDAIRQLVNAAISVNQDNCIIAETGAGLSTLGFLCAAVKQVISVAPDADLFGRIAQAADQRGISRRPLTALINFSELALPPLVLNRDPFIHFALIDGGHNFTTVWTDFTYLNYALLKDGIVAVDDIQLWSCRTLALYLNNSPRWETLRIGAKLALFRKLTDARLEPDFGASPYVRQNSLV
jgi:hypothetical protein